MNSLFGLFRTHPPFWVFGGINCIVRELGGFHDIKLASTYNNKLYRRALQVMGISAGSWRSYHVLLLVPTSVHRLISSLLQCKKRSLAKTQVSKPTWRLQNEIAAIDRQSEKGAMLCTAIRTSLSPDQEHVAVRVKNAPSIERLLGVTGESPY